MLRNAHSFMIVARTLAGRIPLSAIYTCSVQIVHSYYQFITNIEYATNKTELQNYNDSYGLLTA